MDIITVDGIKDFQTCALLYDFRHLQDRWEPIARQEELNIRFENTLRKILAFFFYKKQSGILPSVSSLLNRWEKQWFPKDVTAYDIAVEQHDASGTNMASMSSEAVRTLLRFYDDFSEDINVDPLLINEEFSVPLSKSIRLEGTFDLVLRYSKNHYRVIKWVTSRKRIPISSLMMDMAAMKYAFDYRNQDKFEYQPTVEYGVYDLAVSAKWGFNELEVTQADVNALKYWANSAVASEIFVPRRGLTHYCKTCPFDSPCKEFVVSEKILEIQNENGHIA